MKRETDNQPVLADGQERDRLIHSLLFAGGDETEALKAVALGQYEKADFHWRCVLEADPENTVAALAIAEHAFLQGYLTNALVYLTQAARKGARNRTALTLAALILRDMGAMENLPDDVADIESADDETLAVSVLMGLSAPGLWRAAATVLRDLAVDMGADLARFPQLGADLNLATALGEVRAPQDLLDQLQAEGHPAAGGALFVRLGKVPTDHASWFTLGRECEAEIAAEMFRRAAAFEPENVKYLTNWARSQNALGNYLAAYTAYRSIVMLSGSDEHYFKEEAANSLGSMLTRIIAEIRHALEIKSFAKAWAIFNIIRDNPRLQDTDGLLHTIVSTSARSAVQALRLDGAEGLALAMDHLRFAGGDPVVLRELALSYERRRLFADAAAIWAELEAPGGSDSQPALQLAKCLSNMGDAAGAAEAAKRALAIDPGLKSAQIILDRGKT